ncbi:fused MFS/spermidine synthase [Lipingzhangella sp. LS1_29]|uniref:Fused MFS/spermidine synthase n=1 Tax=Lipingzhangella rawalii TaxID=2055835 RepID=A0ABU2H5J2_9ACTN|nr:fused MFS/spermidine synthase [Lipingzhangella rawalii]MDS1270558.1 fused MFS/spermidine synthase [Lipingzhangella rawalii]
MPHSAEDNGDGDTTVARRTLDIMQDADRPRAWHLVVDGTPQSHVDLDDPTHLEFEYVRRMGHVLNLAAPPGQRLAVFHLGAGALTLARYLAATRPGSRQRAVDNDAELVELVRRELPWERRSGIRVGIEDARAWLHSRGADTADVVIADLFQGARTPAHLTSVEFVAEVARVLRPGGVYLSNVGDGHGLTYARRQVATLSSVFPELSLIAEPGVLRGRRFGNLVLVASQSPLPDRELGRRLASDPQPARLLDGGELARFAVAARVVHDGNATDSPVPPHSTFVR